MLIEICFDMICVEIKKQNMFAPSVSFGLLIPFDLYLSTLSHILQVVLMLHHQLVWFDNVSFLQDYMESF